MSGGDLRIGFVGCGGIGNHHLKIWNTTPGAKVVAVCDIVPERAEKAAETYGARPFTDLAEMLGKAEFDAVDICTPSGLHAEQGIMAAEAGKHVLVEKPIDLDLKKVNRLIRLTDRERLKLACIFQYRFGSQIKRARQMIKRGKLGRIISCSTYVKWWRAQSYYAADDWRGTWALDGGVLANQGIHSIDQMCWMAGPVSEAEYAHIEMIDREIEAETFAVAVVRFKNGARGVIEGTTNCYPGMATRTQIFGTKGSAEFNGGSVVQFKVEGKDVDLESAEAPKQDGRSDPMAITFVGHAAQILDFVQAVREDRNPACDGRSARMAVDCLTKVYRKAGFTGKLGT